MHDHLGLILSQAVYATIPNTVPYTRAILPRLDVQPADTQFQIAPKRYQSAEDLRQFGEVQGVECTVIQQNVAAIEPKYIRALRDNFTQKISKTIPTILKFFV
jgi:hypothetical protein